ncbi:N-acetylmuramoyl-L-alanine amidase [Syntrophomonas erecta subsp. sporosyntropha]
MPKNYIVIHHSASPDHGTLKDFDSIKRWHVEHNGWRNIGYHWVVEKVNGILTAIPGRPEWDTGAHCPGRNQDGIGICIVGNYQETVPDPELYSFVANLCKQIMARHPIQEIGGHRDYTATACPGQHFDVNRVRQLVKGGSAVQDVKVVVKGKELPGKLIDNQTWVPVRELVDALNETVTWQEETKVVVVE